MQGAHTHVVNSPAAVSVFTDTESVHPMKIMEQDAPSETNVRPGLARKPTPVLSILQKG